MPLLNTSGIPLDTIKAVCPWQSRNLNRVDNQIMTSFIFLRQTASTSYAIPFTMSAIRIEPDFREENYGTVHFPLRSTPTVQNRQSLNDYSLSRCQKEMSYME